MPTAQTATAPIDFGIDECRECVCATIRVCTSDPLIPIEALGRHVLRTGFSFDGSPPDESAAGLQRSEQAFSLVRIIMICLMLIKVEPSDADGPDSAVATGMGRAFVRLPRMLQLVYLHVGTKLLRASIIVNRHRAVFWVVALLYAAAHWYVAEGFSLLMVVVAPLVGFAAAVAAERLSRKPARQAS